MRNKKAIASAIARHSRRQDRLEHPDGTFDKAGRWWPTDAEAAGCDHAREPSRSYPYSQLKAARSLNACALLEKADAGDCRSVKATLARRGFEVGKMYIAEEVLDAMKEGLRKNWEPVEQTADPEKTTAERDADPEHEADDGGADLA